MPRQAKPKEEKVVAKDKSFMELLGTQGMGLVRPPTTGRNMGILPTGCLPLDIATSRGGLKGGTISIFTGEPGVGKSSICYRIAAQAQAKGMGVLIWDTESRWSAEIAYANGLDLEEDASDAERKVGVIRWSPYVGTDMDDGEAKITGVLQEVQAAVRIFFTSEPVKSKGGVFIIDSINFQRTQEQLQGEDEDKKKDGTLYASGEGGGIAILARLMANWMPELLAYVSHPNHYCVITRQNRANINASYGGSPVSFSGGWAIKYANSLHVIMTRIKKLAPSADEEKAGIERHGDLIRLTTEKNTNGFNRLTTEYEMTVAHGIDDIAAVAKYGVSAGLVTKSSGWYAFRLSNGEWTKKMYLTDAQNWFWESEENVRELAILMEGIRRYYARIPDRRMIFNDSVGNTATEQGTGEHTEGEPEPVPQDAT